MCRRAGRRGTPSQARMLAPALVRTPGASHRKHGEKTATGRLFRFTRCPTRHGMVVTAKITNYGGILTTSLRAPDRRGQLWATSCWAMTRLARISRQPWRYVLRRAHRAGTATASRRGTFTLDGKTYSHLRPIMASIICTAAKLGLTRKVWAASPVQSPTGVGLALRYVSPDGEEGYPWHADGKSRLHAYRATTACGSTTLPPPTRTRCST